jgi:hypothetical protein
MMGIPPIFKAKLLDNVTIPEQTLNYNNYHQTTSYQLNLDSTRKPQYQPHFMSNQHSNRS